MTTLLILLVGLGVMGATLTVAIRGDRDRRARQHTLEARLLSLRPDTPLTGARRTLFGPEAGPRYLRIRFARADMQLSVRSGVIAAAVLAAAILAAVWLQHPILALLLAAVGFGGGLLALEFAADRNVAALLRELPFFLDGVRQHLAVGASLQQALIRGVEQADEAIVRYFGPAVRRIQNGATVIEALGWLSDRLALAEIDMLTLAVQTNTRFGGAMSPTLANLSGILREQARVGRELKAATAETRFSAWVLAGMPVLAAAFIAFANPGYVAFLTGTSTGHVMLGIAVGFQAVGCLVLMRILKLSF